MCSGVKKVISAVVKAIKKVWDVIRKYIAYIAFFAILFFPYLLPFVTAYLPAGLVALVSGTVLTASTFTALAWRAVIGLAVAFVFSSEGAAEIVDKVSDVVSKTVEGVTEVAGSAAEGLASGIMSSPFALVAIGIGLWWLLSRDDEEPSTAAY